MFKVGSGFRAIQRPKVSGLGPRQPSGARPTPPPLKHSRLSFAREKEKGGGGGGLNNWNSVELFRLRYYSMAYESNPKPSNATLQRGLENFPKKSGSSFLRFRVQGLGFLSMGQSCLVGQRLQGLEFLSALNAGCLDVFPFFWGGLGALPRLESLSPNTLSPKP